MNRLDAREPRVGAGDACWAIDRTSATPLHLQIKNALRQLVASWPNPSEPFYTDWQLRDLFAVSRMTVRQAVLALVEEGLLRRRRGAGTFVVTAGGALNDAAALGLIAEAAETRRVLSTRNLDFETVACPPVAARALGIAEGARVRYVRRLRSAGDVPVALDHRYISPLVGSDFVPAERLRSLLHDLWDRYDFAQAEMEIEAIAAGEEEVKWLCVLPGDPLIVRRLRYLARDGNPIIVGHSLYRADLVRFTAQMPLTREAHDKLQRNEGLDYADYPVRLRSEVSLRRDGA